MSTAGEIALATGVHRLAATPPGIGVCNATAAGGSQQHAFIRFTALPSTTAGAVWKFHQAPWLCVCPYVEKVLRGDHARCWRHQSEAIDPSFTRSISGNGMRWVTNATNQLALL